MTITKPAKTVEPAVSLSLNKSGQESFVRMAEGLPGLVSRLAPTVLELNQLSKDLLFDSDIELDENEKLTLNKLAVDIQNVLDQVQDPSIKKRLTEISQRLANDLFDFSVPNKEDSTDFSKSILEREFKILKQEGEDEFTVFGIVLEPETIDAQKDIYSEDEVRKTAWKFLEVYQSFGLMHKEIVPFIRPLESYLAPVEFSLNGETVKKGTWLLRVRVLDTQVWEDIKSGKITGFSIGGNAIRRPENQE